MTRTTVAAVLCAVAGLLLFVAAGFSTGHSDSYNYAWSVHYLDIFSSGALLPRHLPGLWAGLGGYDFFFYGPLPFWVMAAVVSPVCVGCEVSTKIVMTAAFFWLMSGVTCFVFLRRYCKQGAALFGAMVYAVLPYHLLLDWFVRQAVGEFVAYMFLPLIALGVDAIRLDRPGKYWLPIGIAGMLLCHLPTSVLAAHIGVFVVLVFALLNLRQKLPTVRFVLETILLATLGGLLACFYWLPAVALLDHVASDLLYGDHFIATRWLLQFGLDQTAPDFGKPVLWSFLAIIPIIVVAALYSKDHVRVWILAPTVLAIFLNTELATVIWGNWIINRVQFPWRMLVFVDFAAAISVAFLATKVGELPRSALAAILVLFVVSTVVVFRSILPITTPYDTNNPTPGASEYLSRQMHSTIRRNERSWDRFRGYETTERIFDQVSQINRGRLNYEVSHRQATVVLLEDADVVLLPIQHWEFWVAATSDGNELPIAADETLGVISIAAVDFGFAGQEIRLRLPYHWSEIVGLFLSAAALGILLAIFWTGRRKAILVRP